MKNLIFDMEEAYRGGETRHAQTVLRDLGITYRYAQCVTVIDSWIFFNCEPVPDSLPIGLTEYTVDPMTLIGKLLSKEVAERIVSYKGGGEPTPPIVHDFFG